MNLLAFDTSTSRLFAAVQRGPSRWLHEDAGSAQSSATLIPALQALLAQAQLRLPDLHAIAFGRGPGAFTGLRTACAVAQGLAFGAGVPVLPIDTLMAVAEAARLQQGAATRVRALLDARMGELYVADYAWTGAAHGWQTLSPPAVCPPEGLPSLPSEWAHAPAGDAPVCLAGNAFAEYGARLPAALAALPRIEALPTAAALLSLAPAVLASGAAVPAQQALPLYIRDKVAYTTAERLARGGVR